MKERPILFSAEMMTAILTGQKTQTRRIVKPANPRLEQFCIKEGDPFPFYFRRKDAVWDSFATMEELTEKHCPHGKPGDTLWVRETWAKLSDYTGNDPGAAALASGYFYRQQGPDAVSRWRPSIFMPRAACRLTLEIKSVRIERLQDISPADAMAEGVADVAGFRDLWDRINAKRGYPWESNPWVWGIKFAPPASIKNPHQY